MGAVMTRRRFTVGEYECMGQAGILREDERVELIEGEIIEMAALGSRHAGCVNQLNNGLKERLGSRVVIATQNPMQLSRGSEPQPDIAVLRPRADYYRRAHPLPADVLLLIEVADTSLRYDREVKLPLYAAAGIPEVWIVNLVDERVEVYRRPAATGYRSVTVHERGATLTPEAFSELALPVAEILG